MRPNFKLQFMLVLVLAVSDGTNAAADDPYFAVQSKPQPLTPALTAELKGCFDFFLNETVTQADKPTYGMVNGNYIGLHVGRQISIEGQGFLLAAMPIGVSRGWIDRAVGYERSLRVLKTIAGLKNIHGFHYHFIDADTGRRGWNDSVNVELTNMGTATMLAGALIAGEFFGGEVKQQAEALYRQADWRWFLDPRVNHFYLACYPEDVPPGKRVLNKDGFFGHWGAYSEHLLMYVLGAGAPNPEFATSATAYESMQTRKAAYKGEPFIYCFTGSAFTYQWTHCFVDFRNMVDGQGRNWFENSRQAALAARQYAVDKSATIKGFGENSWGMTACMCPTQTYSGRYGSLPAGRSGSDESVFLLDGTVAPCGPLGFIVFTPEASIAALDHMRSIPGLTGRYGLYDAYSFHTKANGERPWIAASYLDIDKGVTALMIENYSTQLIWRLFHQNSHIQRGLQRLGFVPTTTRSLTE